MSVCVLQLAKAYGMDFFETSAFTNHNITEVSFKEPETIHLQLLLSVSHTVSSLSGVRSQTFTRLAEQVLAANKKDLDLLRMSLNDELSLAALEEEEERLCDGATGDQRKGCWC